MSYGIKETSDVLSFSINLSMAIDEAISDGFTALDLVSILPAFVKFPEAISGIDQILDELNDMDEAEKAELVAVVEELDLASDKTEEIVEQSLITFIEIAHLIMIIREAKKPVA